MSFIKAIDCSHWQGTINWQAVRNSGVEIAIMKMSGGEAGLYYDNKASVNYYQAKNAGVAVGMYHFAGGTDAIAEADYFVGACSPLEENDVLVLDWEVKHSDPVGWCDRFVNRVHEKTGVWCLIYFNGSTWNSYDWSRITSKCGVWVAWYGRNPEDNLPVPGKYVMHQYTSTGSVAGISGNVDLDAWFGTVEQFKKYGWHAPVATPTPQPTHPPVPVPEPTPEPVPEPTPVVEEKPVEVSEPISQPQVVVVQDSPLDVENNKLLKSIIGRLTNIGGWIKKILAILSNK